jgi:glycine/D-amino acid oxidase-like deaminating enzyme
MSTTKARATAAIRPEVLSLWHDTLEPGDAGTPRPALTADLAVDVAIVGAGFGGLWTAYHLLSGDPALRVAVIERDTAGFGASGRNGGWCVGDQGAPLPVLEQEAGRAAAIAMARAVQESVDEVGAVAAAEGIDCGFAKGGALYFASTAAQLRRHERTAAGYHRYGFTDDYRILTPRACTEIINATGIHGGLWTDHAAAVHPARLARGLARAVERLGGRVFEQTAVRRIEAGRAITEGGAVTADVVVRATEAYTPTIEGREREILPVDNFMIATEPLTEEVWAEIGLRRREVFEDSPALLAYGQRTADDRIAWGGLGAGYRLGSRIPSSPMHAPAVAARLRARLIARFPVLADVEITHHWGGILGMHRDLRPSVGVDRATGNAWIGGFGGSGVASSQAAGRSLADVILERDTDHARLPWVGHVSRPWEKEPLRWLGVHGMLTLARLNDRRDSLRG